MGGQSVIIVGGTGVGKTTFIKERLKKVHPKALLLYDVNNEYTDIIKAPLIDFKKFTEIATRVKNGVIVFEEATIFLNNKGSNADLYDILVRKRHTNNTIFLVFHSFRFIPSYIYNLCNRVIVFKTNDPRTLVDSKFNDENLTVVYDVVNAGPKYAHKEYQIY